MNTVVAAVSLRRFGVVGLGLIALLAGGCGVEQLANAATNAVNVIDRGIDQIGQQSASWQATLQQVAKDLPADLQSTIRTEVDQLAARSIATAGVEFRCNVDFLADRAQQALRRIKAQLLGQTPPPVEPGFCQVSPASLDLNLPIERRSVVTVFGYDLDRVGADGKQLTFVCEGANGQMLRTLEPGQVGRTTHYQITLQLGSEAFSAFLHHGKVAKLRAFWDGRALGPEVVVVPWVPGRRPVTAALGRKRFVPPRTQGDADFHTDDDEPMSVVAEGESRLRDNTIETRVYLKAREDRPDHTTVEGHSAWETAYSPPAGWRIRAYQPASTRFTGRINAHGTRTFTQPAAELVQRFEIYGDGSGDEAGTKTSVEAFFGSVQLELEQIPPFGPPASPAREFVRPKIR